LGRLWQEVQCGGVFGADDGEVPPVQGGNVTQVEPLDHCNNRCVNGAEWQIGIGAHKLGYACNIAGSDGDVLELICGNCVQKRRLDLRPLLQQPATSTITVVGTGSGPLADSSKAAQRA